VGVLDVDVGDGEIAFDHFEGGVAEDALQGVNVPLIAKIVDGEGVSEAVGMDLFDAGAQADAQHEFAQHFAVEGVVQVGDEEWIISARLGLCSCS